MKGDKNFDSLRMSETVRCDEVVALALLTNPKQVEL
jgi:hypothetical protein